MALPVQSVRASPEHRDVLQKVADLLKQGHADDLRRRLDDFAMEPVGPFKSEAAAVAFLRDRLVSALRPRTVWLFGSRARGTARRDSDFDLLVVLPDDLPDHAYTHHAVSAPLVACGLPYDVVPCRWSTFLAASAEENGILARATREGRVLYEDPALRKQRPAA
jgi:predicted nucleotidyltransferase